MRPWGALTGALVALALAGCGGGGEEAAPPATVTVTQTETAPVPADTGGAPADTGGAEAAVDAGDLKLQYVPVSNQELQVYVDFLAASQLVEGIVEGVNDTVALPKDLIVSIEETGGDPSPFYTPEAEAIVLPPEWLVFSDQLFSGSGLVSTPEEAQTLILASTAFVFLHELGHLLIDQLDIPITGREEDAVDQLATAIITQTGIEEAGNVALAGGLFFGLLGANREAFEAADFWDEHSLNEQRFFNIICWVYGSDPQQFAEIPAQAGLGEDRLARCQDEYLQLASSWEALLGPYVKA
jgi:hypothetical protein